MTFSEMTKFFMKETKSGSDTDMLVQVYAGNFLENPFLQIELDTTHELLHMLEGSDKYFIYPSVSNDEYLFTSLYSPSESSPLARCYFVRKKTKAQYEKYTKELEAYNYKFKEINYFEFAILIEHLTLEDRKKIFLQKRQEKTGAIKNLFDGRKNNTTTSGGIVLQTDTCLVCHKPISHNLSTTLSADKGLLISFNVCENCYEQAKVFNGSNLDYLLNSLGVHNDFIKSEPLTDIELLEMTKKVVTDELECEIEKINDLTIMGYRKSGYKIILRLQRSSIDKIDYGYMIYAPDGTQVARIDSANHHNDKLASAPDHLHYDLKNANELVKSSYTTGYLPLDIVGIKSLLEQWEEENI